MTTIAQARPDTGPDLSPTYWRIGGGLAIAHVVVLFAGLSQEVSVVHGDSLATITRVYGGANLTRVFTGGYVEAMSFLLLTAAVVVVARLIGRHTEVGRLASQAFLALGVVFVASTLAVGFAPGAAAIYGVQHGADIHAVAMVNDLRAFGYDLQVAVQAGMALALGIAALSDKIFTKWVGWVGVAIGILGIVATPFAENATAMVWLVWWVGLGVLFLRGGPKTARNR
jgi:hypothetical protein